MAAREVASIALWVLFANAILGIVGGLILGVDADWFGVVRIIGWAIVAVLLLVAGVLYVLEHRRS